MEHSFNGLQYSTGRENDKNEESDSPFDDTTTTSDDDTIYQALKQNMQKKRESLESELKKKDCSEENKSAHLPPVKIVDSVKPGVDEMYDNENENNLNDAPVGFQTKPISLPSPIQPLSISPKKETEEKDGTNTGEGIDNKFLTSEQKGIKKETEKKSGTNAGEGTDDKFITSEQKGIKKEDFVPNVKETKQRVVANNQKEAIEENDVCIKKENDDMKIPTTPKTVADPPMTPKTTISVIKANSPAKAIEATPLNQYGEYDEDVEEPDFDIDAFDIENPDNTLSELLLYLEHQTIDVISTIQSLLTSIKQPEATTGELRKESNAINQVISQMVDATSVSMNQSRHATLKEHGNWVVQSLDDCRRRMTILCHLNKDGVMKAQEDDEGYADKHFKQRLAGIAFDVAKCTKELVKTVEEASLKEEIDFLNSRLTK